MKMKDFEKLSSETKNMLKKEVLSAISDVDSHFRRIATGDMFGQVTEEQLAKMPEEQVKDWLIIDSMYEELEKVEY